jgi:4-amino-4-deoxy-L-arabinose transferase-like glycosyltransferase
MDFKFNRYSRLLLWILILLPIWVFLGKLPIVEWDESRLVANAFEMSKDHHWVTTHYNGQPDMWNTKPPLLIWLMVASIKLFGVTEWALRLPSALAGTATCILLYWFIRRATKNELLAFITLVILVTSYGFIKYHHSVRTADYDSLLTLFSTAYILFYYLFIEEGRQKYLFISIVCMTLAVMTKGVAGLFFLPGLFIYTVYRRKLATLIRSPFLYLGLVFFALVVAGYYFLREGQNPGYLNAVMDNELGGRLNKPLDGHDKQYTDSFYYYTFITRVNFKFWYYFIPFGLALALYAVEQSFKKIIILSLCLCIVFFAVIAFAANKHDWYDMPMYPLLSMVVAIGIYLLATLLSKLSVWEGVLSRNALPFVFLPLAATAYLHIMTSSLKPDPGEWAIENTSMARYLKAIYHGVEAPPDSTVLIATPDVPPANLEWYTTVMKAKNINAGIQKYEELTPGRTVIFYNDKLFWRVEADYDFVLVRRLLNDRVRIYHLNAKRQ